MTVGRRRLIALAAVGLALATGAAAIAGPGRLTYKGCVANRAAYGCAEPRRPSLGNNIGMALSADGQSLYVATVEGVLTRLARDPATGSLLAKDCLADGGRRGCRDIPHDSLDPASDVAVSPDGTSAYVTAGQPASAITQFARDATGRLSYGSCVANGGKQAGTAGCFRPPRNSLASNEAIAISPDGTSVYVVSSGSDSITWFDRTPSGALIYRGCFANKGGHGCQDPRRDSLGGAFDVVVTPDGKSVYIASLAGDAVTRFNRGPTGALVYRGCFANDGEHGCRTPESRSLDGADALAVSPGGSSLYVASLRGSAVTLFRRSPNGRLEPGSCFANGGSRGCRKPAENSLHAADDIAVSPDGTSVYVTAMSGSGVNGGAGALSVFDRHVDGSLASTVCFADAGRHHCRAPTLPSLGSPQSIAVTEDGRSVYVGSYARSVSALQRALVAP